jgi:hypothetical protein
MRVLLILLATAAVIWALVECIQSEDSQVRYLPKVAWILVILFGPVVGAVAWFFLGRPRSTRPSRRNLGVPRNGRPAAPDGRRPAPDDDPEFLRKIGRDSEHEQMLRRWEEDLQRRESELHDPDDPEPPEAGEPPSPPSR